MQLPNNDRDVLITLKDGSTLTAYHDAEWMPEGAFADENYNACSCDACGSPSDSWFHYPVSWRELPS